MMEYRALGNTGMKVSRMCFGALTIGPLQAKLSIQEGAKVINRALEGGVNFIDTAQLYGTYPYIKAAIASCKHDVIITSKSYAYTAKDMEKSLQEALAGIGRDYIDIFLLHEQESILTVKGHWEAVEYLLRAKEKGMVRAIGLSTHMVAGAQACIQVPEIEILHPLINYQGVGIGDGTADQMLAAIREAAALGKGIYGMKPLGGGNLIDDYQKAIDFALGLPELAAVAIGMKSVAEVDFNLRVFSGQAVPDDLRHQVQQLPRKLHIEEWCVGCGRCVQRCHSKALSIQNNQVQVDHGKCLKCGYCGSVCPDFCIKII